LSQEISNLKKHRSVLSNRVGQETLIVRCWLGDLVYHKSSRAKVNGEPQCLLCQDPIPDLKCLEWQNGFLVKHKTLRDGLTYHDWSHRMHWYQNWLFFSKRFFFSFFARHLSMGLARHEVDNLNLHVGLDRPSLHIKMPIVATEKKRSILF